MKFPKLLVSAGLSLILAVTAHAQSTTGTVSGVVSDPSGAKIANATVTLTDVKTKVATTGKTNEHGEYLFAAVNPSDFTVTVTMENFKSETQTGITVDANDNVNVGFTLTPGGANENVEVTAGTTMVDTREAQIGETIDQARIEELPTLNRDPYQLLQSVTGVNSFTADILIGGRDGVQFSVNGMPTNTTSYYLDGAQNNLLRNGGGNKAPAVEALQQFRILTSNFDAEFGRSPGAIVNLITKNGTDAYHGELYEFLQNNMFDARPYFSFLDTNFNYNLKQHQFGGDSGGPIPGLRQTFFFVDYAHVQLHTDAYLYPNQYTTPTAAEVSGDFSADPAVTGSTTATASIMKYSCTGTTLVVCPNNLDPVAQAVFKFVPKSTNPLTDQPPTQTSPSNNTVDQGLIRIDYNGIQKHQIEGTFFDSRGSGLDPTGGGTNQVYSYAGATVNNNTNNAILADNWIATNNLVNSFRVFYTGNRSVLGEVFPNHLAPNLGATYPLAGPAYNSAPPRFQLGNGFINIGTQNYGPNDVNQQTFGIVDVATISIGQHQIKAGASYIWDKYSEYNAYYDGGFFTITGDPLNVGDRFADMLLGDANTFQQTTPQNFHRHNFDPAIFVQDDWHALPRLTLNLGVRWEVYPPFYGDGTSGTFRAGQQSTIFPTAPIGILYEGDTGVAPGIANTPYLDFAPRLGFAWDIYGNGQTSLRGGFGMFYYQQVVYDENRYQMPYGLTEDLNPDQQPDITSYVNPWPSGGGPTVSPFPYTVNTKNPQYVPGATVYATPPGGGKTPYAEEFNLSIEQQLSKTYALHIAYVGSNYIKQLQGVDLNAATLPTLQQLQTTIPAANARRPYEPYGITGSGSPTGFFFQAINMLRNSLNTNYNSLQSSLRGRLGRQINLNMSYTWSRTMDNSSPSYALQPRSGYGRSNLDIRNRFVISGLFQLPQTHRLGWFGKQVLDGWRVNALAYAQSGAPFYIYSDTDENHDGVSDDRPNLILPTPYNTAAHTHAQKAHEYINPTAFLSISTAQSIANYGQPNAFNGSEQRNILSLPMTTNSNVSVFKEFALPKETRLQFRAEAFNAFNNVNFTTPRTDLSTIGGTTNGVSNLANPLFFQLQNTLPARQIQFGIRFLY